MPIVQRMYSPSAVVDPDQLALEAQAAGLGELRSCAMDANILTMDFVDDPDSDLLDTVIGNHTPGQSRVRAYRIEAIDRRTSEIIAGGFEFAGMRFSLSASGQSSLIAADAQRDDPMFSYPVTWNTIDDEGSIDLPDSATLHGFVLTAVGTVRAALDSGTVLKSAVRNAASDADVLLVVDPR